MTANVSGGTLKIAVAGTLSDTSGDRWKLVSTAATALLLFDSSIGTIGTLNGNFVVPNGTVKIDHAITTNGGLEQSGGTTEVNADFTLDADFATHADPANLTGGTVQVAAAKHFRHY